MRMWLPLILILTALIVVAQPVSGVTTYDITVGTDKLVYNVGDKAVISGYVKSELTGRAVSRVQVNAVVTYNGEEIYSGSTTTSYYGSYRLTQIPVDKSGTYNIQVTVSSGRGTGYGSFKAESEKQYTLTADKYIYSVGERAVLSLDVVSVGSDGTTSPASGVTVPLKIKTDSGRVLKTVSLTTGRTGKASTSYTIEKYGKYVAVVGNGLAIAKFEAPAFEVKLDTLTSEDKSKDLYSSSDNLVLRVVAVVKTDRGSLPVKGAEILATIKDSEGNVKNMDFTFTEVQDGVYKSNSLSLSSYGNGKYYVDVKVTKGQTQNVKTSFEVQSYRVELEPISGYEHTFGFLKNSEATLGIVVEDMSSGEELTEDKIVAASISECRNSRWEECDVGEGQLNAGLKDFAKTLTFTAPNETGEYYIKASITVTTTSGSVNVTGGAWISVQSIITFVENKDKFGGYRWRYGPGESVTLEVKAIGSGWQDATEDINSVRIVEVRDDDWNNKTSNITDISYSSNTVEFDAPRDSGRYNVKLRITMNDGSTAYAGTDFEVSLYDIWADTKKLDENNNWQWEWRFGNEDDVYLHINVRKLGDQVLPVNKIAKITVPYMINEITGKKYTNLRVNSSYGTAVNWEGEEVPVVKVSLNGLGLTSGFYHMDIEVTDTEGNKETGGAWFKVSNLDVMAWTMRSSGEDTWQFGPSDNVTIKVDAKYFNQTNVPDGSNVSIDKLMSMRDGPPVSISSEKYTTSGTQTTKDGIAYLWLKPVGEPLPQGHYMAIVKVVANDGSGIEENSEAWFDIRVMQIETSMSQQYYSQSQDVAITVTVKNADGTPISNANVTLAELRDTINWQEIDIESLGISANGITNSQGKTTLQFPAQNLSAGEYEARIEAKSSTLNSKSDTQVWFSIQNYKIEGWFVTEPGRQWGVYAPGEEVTMQIKVLYPNSTWDREYPVRGESVSIYQMVNVESWPWTYKSATMVSSTETSIPGVYQIKFKAPQETGRFHPMVNISGELSKTPWALPDLEVRDLAVSISTYSDDRETDEFTPGENITTKITINNPSGNELPTISEVKLENYRNINTQETTTLGGKITTNIGNTNTLTFSAPNTEGEFILTVSVKTANATIQAQKWFRVVSFNLEAWTERWSYSPGDTVQVNVKAHSPGGNANVDINVTTLSIRNVWETSYILYNETGANIQTISGEGKYNLTAPDEIGEYESRLCIFTGDSGGSWCENGQEVFIHFSVESYRIDSWPDEGGSFTSQENVSLNVELRYSGGSRLKASEYEVSLNSLVKAMTQEDVTSRIAGNVSYGYAEGPDEQYRRTVMFPAGRLDEGEYEAILNITVGDESRMWRSWFRVSGYDLLIQTEPPEYDPWQHPFPVNENITFNITVTPTPSDVGTGTLYIKNNFKNWEDAINPVTFNLTNGNALVNVSLTEVGEYTAVASVGTAERHWWFKVSAFGFNIIHEQSSHEIKPEDDVTITFELLNRTGQAEFSSVNISVLSVRNARDWVKISEDVFNDTVSLDENGRGSITFSPSSGNLQGGEYEAELSISLNGKSQTEFFWFQVRTLMFNAWHQDSFLPGEEIVIEVELLEPDGTPISGSEIIVEEVNSGERGYISSSDYNYTSGITDSSGRTNVKLNLPKEVTGWVDVRLKDTNSNEVRWVGFNVNGYKLDLDRNWEKWSFSTGENYTANLYAYDPNGLPAKNKVVKVKVYKEGNWETPCFTIRMNNTDANGFSEINFSCNALDGTGHYELNVIVDDAAVKRDWFKVESYHIDAWAQGSSTGNSEITPSENVRIMVRVEEIGTGNPISGANVSLFELHPVPQWEPTIEFPSIIQDNQVTDSSGFAELKFAAPSEGEYVVRISVSHPTYGDNVGDTWFRITSTMVTFRITCPIIDGDVVACRDPNSRMAGDTVNIEISGLGELKTVLTGVRDQWRNEMISYYEEASGINKTILNFTAPDREGNYEAIFDIYVKKDGYWEHRSEERAWFEVLSSSGLMAHTWVEPQNAWAGKNATIGIHIEDFSSWGEVVCEEGSDIRITEIKDGWDWRTKLTGDQIEQTFEPPSMTGPPESRINFLVPNLTAGREYVAMVNITCVHDGTTDNLGVQEAWFRVAAFQVSNLMDENLEVNQTVYYWVKVTDANGNPIQGATITQEKLVGEPNWEPINMWSGLTYTTDENGEAIGTFQAPKYSGHFELWYTVQSGDTVQKMNRWFQIEGIDANIELEKTKFFTTEDVNISVKVIDAVTNEPIEGANVRLNVFPMMRGPDEAESGGGEGGYPTEGELIGGAEEIHFPETQTDPNGYANFTLLAQNTSSNEYMIITEVCTDDKGCTWIEKNILISNFNITASLNKEYEPGDTIFIQLEGEDVAGQPLAGAKVFAGLMNMSKESSADLPTIVNTTGVLDESGRATLNLTIPESESGISMVMVRVNYSELVDTQGFLVVIHQSGISINVTANSTATPGGFIDAYINTTSTELSVAPFVMHLERIGTSIPISQMMSGGKSENWYDSPIYLKKGGNATHMKILAADKPGDYTAVIMFIEEGSTWFGPEDMADVIFVNYAVQEV